MAKIGARGATKVATLTMVAPEDTDTDSGLTLHGVRWTLTSDGRVLTAHVWKRNGRRESDGYKVAGKLKAGTPVNVGTLRTLARRRHPEWREE